MKLKVIKGTLIVYSILLAGCLQCPAVAKNANFVDSLDTLFGKSEAELQKQFGKAQKAELMPSFPRYKDLTFVIPAGPGNHPCGDTVKVIVSTEDGIASAARFWYLQPERMRTDLLSCLGRSSLETAAISRNLLDDKVRELGRPKGAVPTAPMVKGATDAERWALVKDNLLRLDSMDDQQVRAIFGEGYRREISSDKSYSFFDRNYFITPFRRVPASKLNRAFRFEIDYISGIVASVKIERDEHDSTEVVYLKQIQPKLKNAAFK